MHVTFPYQFCVSKRPATLFGPSEVAMAKVLGVLCLIPVLAEKACQGETCEDSSLMQLDRCSDQWRCHVICSVNMCAGFVCRSFFRHCGMSAHRKMRKRLGVQRVCKPRKAEEGNGPRRDSMVGVEQDP